MGDQFCLRWNNHQSTVVSVVESLLNSDSLTDCTLAAEGRSLKAHKLILTACSPYFEALLSQHHDKHPIFILKDVKFYELRAMLDYMYRGEVNISQDQLDSFIKTAESLQIKGLTDQGGGGGGEDLSPPRRKPPPMPAQRPESPPAGAAPAREGSPLAKRRRRTVVTGAALEEGAPAPPDPARLAVAPKAEPPDSPPPPPAHGLGAASVKAEALEDVEDLTLDDEEEDDSYGHHPQPPPPPRPPPASSIPGTSFDTVPHTSQDYSQWQMTGDRSTDEVFMAAQEAINSQSNSQVYICLCGKIFRHQTNYCTHRKWICGQPPRFMCPMCPYRTHFKANLRTHLIRVHKFII